ncbi:ETX/MTX2 family pore-forming toxin [Kitasatospora sp. NPDC088779]|uniref:ETX/MTX2 family pore-forming toxin n=1 Tax=Kitasatospora sp. NPDC088779 TaxID=3154964 RepID=UPI00342B6E0D
MTNYLERIFTDALTKGTPFIKDIPAAVRAALAHTRAEVLGDATLSSPSIKPLPDSQQIYSIDYTNDTSVEQSQTLKISKDVTRSVTVSKTKTFEADQEISMEVKLEGFGSMGGKIGFKEGQSSTSSEEKSVTETWGVDTPVRVPPHTGVTAVVFVDEGELTVGFEGRAHLYLHFDDGKEYEIGVFISYLDLGTDETKAYYGFDLEGKSAADSPRYRLDGTELIGRATGSLSAKAGVRVRTVVTERKKGAEETPLQVLETLPGDAQVALLGAVLENAV